MLSFAQEANTRQYGTLEGQSDNRYYETNSESESLTSKPATAKQDSIGIRSAVKKTTPELIKQTAKKADEDAIPFNFLYYIIQRFKASDIIED